MSDDICQDVKTYVESTISAKTDELKESVAGFLSRCAKETSIMEELDALKVLAVIEARF